MPDMTAQETQICNWLGQQLPAMIALLKESVNTGSGSYDKAGVDAVGRVFEQFFSAHGLLTDREAIASFGDAIHIRLDDKQAMSRRFFCWAIATRCFQKARNGAGPSRWTAVAPTARALRT